MNTPGDLLKRLCDKGSPKKAPSEKRIAFARAVVKRLAVTYPLAKHAQNAPASKEPFARQILAVIEAVNDLNASVVVDPLGARTIGLTYPQITERADPLTNYLFTASLNALSQIRPRRGRNNRAEVVMATMIAEEYHAHFDQFPGRSKQTDANNPFAEACTAVSEYFTGKGYRIQIGPTARSKAVESARRNGLPRAKLGR